MEVRVLDHFKLSNAVIAARTCWNSFHKGGNYKEPTDNISEVDKELLQRLLFKEKHESVFESIYYCFNIQDITRFVLVELSRHRIASYSVESTRYTLKRLKYEKSFKSYILDRYEYIYDLDRASEFIEINPEVNTNFQVQQLEFVREVLLDGASIDDAKYLLPENYLTDLVWTINVRSLRNFLQLRLSKSAHKAIRSLAKAVYEAIPAEHKFLFEDIANENSNV